MRRIKSSITDRQDPKPVEVEDTIYRKENRRDMLTSRFSKHTVAEESDLTVTTTKPQKKS